MKNIKKEITLFGVANDLQNILGNLKKHSIEDLEKKLKGILLDMYTLLNISEKSKSKQAANEANKINISSDEIKTENIKKEDDKLNSSIQSGNSDINNTKANDAKVVTLDKDAIKSSEGFSKSSRALEFVSNNPDAEKIERTHYYKNGAVYKGQMKNGVPNGRGIITYSSGLIYDGEWKNGVKDGKGKYYLTKDKKDIYEGDFKNGKAEGYGKSDYSNGDRYEGQYLNWNKHGKGKYFYNNEDRYEGDFCDDKIEGKGIYYYKNKNKYVGEFKNSRANGFGIFYYNAGDRTGDRYEGYIKDFNMEGKGLYYYHKGDIYEGDFKNDKREGRGIIYFANGDREMGNCLNDKKVGKHVKLTAKGKVTSSVY